MNGNRDGLNKGCLLYLTVRENTTFRTLTIRYIIYHVTKSYTQIALHGERNRIEATEGPRQVGGLFHSQCPGNSFFCFRDSSHVANLKVQLRLDKRLGSCSFLQTDINRYDFKTIF